MSPHRSTVTTESYAHNLVYRRRKLSANPAAIFFQQAPTGTKRSGEDYLSGIGSAASSVVVEEQHVVTCPSSFAVNPHLSTITTMSEGSAPNLVYRRRKLHENSVAIVSAQSPTSAKRSGEDSLSAISSDAPLVAVKEQHVVSESERAAGAPVLPYLCKEEPHVLKSESINGCSLVEERDCNGASKNCSQKIIEVDSINDSCSSSKSDMELVSASLHSEANDASECSSSAVMIVEAMGEDLSEKDLCVSIIRSQRMLEGVWPSRTHVSAECVSDSTSSNSRSCKICSHPESTHKLLICDNCEGAFHLSCCNPRVNRVPFDEWFCHSCSKKRHKILKERISRRSSNMIGDKSRCGNSNTSELNPIALMLRDIGSYTTGVRIGKGFQAEVPDWSGPITDDADSIGETLVMDGLDFVYLTELKSNKPKLSSIGNWLQCREVIDGAGEGANGTICGKWRRAPLFEVQTDNWECFSSVPWDPLHADCAVPQELDTDQVLKQLKYIQMLRP